MQDGTQHAKLQATFTTQANALLRKNAVFQRRNRRSNCCIICAPILFCLILLLIQQAVDRSITNADSAKCGCKCLECCSTLGDGSKYCRVDSGAGECSAGSFDECKRKDETQCGLAYSDGGQSAYCAIPSPSSWPAMLQVPAEQYRAVPFRPAAAFLYTGENRTRADSIAARLFPTASATAVATASAVATFVSQLQKGSLYGELFSLLGYNLGTDAEANKHLYVESAFLSGNSTRYNMVQDCAADSSTASLNALVRTGVKASGLTAVSYLAQNFTCASSTSVWQSSKSDIDRALYCGFQQARCNVTRAEGNFNSYVQAWDFRNSDEARLNLNMFTNRTDYNGDGGNTPNVLRENKGLNLAVNAWLAWALGPQYNATLLGVMEMPKQGNKLNLDLSSLLGPIFFSWLAQLLLPVMLVALVYEKEHKLRMMMRMHGLGDGAYWSIQYCWFLFMYCAYIVLLLLFGSAINLSFFRRNSYGVQIIFYLLWGNCLIAFAFLVSTVFTNTKTAVVSAFLLVFGTGLLGQLLLQTFFRRNQAWVYIVELIPSFALYRGLWEFAQYSFRAGIQNTDGLTFDKLSDDNNHMRYCFAVFVVEWAIFLPLAWYLEQVLPSGTGVRRPPLFFLDRWRRKPAVAPHTFVPDDASALAVQVEAADVAEERRRVETFTPDDIADQSIVISNLRKVYPGQDGNPSKLAVRGLTMSVQKGECFGLLGPNGAGKSTTLNILCGLLEPTSGSAVVEGYSMPGQMEAIYAVMGVCPQHDLLWEQLTSREHLRFYGRLKDLKGRELDKAVDAALRSVNLFNGGVGDKQVRQYSGGMKRRLSVAISLMGNPAVVYLDEPSTGLDPASRRNLWDVVKAAKANRGIILTTHSMEEAEVLCDRLGIFVDGQLVCVGNPKQLTARYGGYLEFTVTTPPGADVERADAFVRSFCPGAKRTYALGGTQKYELPTSQVTLSGVFDAMVTAKQQLTVLDWGVANATLEAVFIKFARSIGAEGGN